VYDLGAGDGFRERRRDRLQAGCAFGRALRRAPRGLLGGHPQRVVGRNTHRLGHDGGKGEGDDRHDAHEDLQ